MKVLVTISLMTLSVFAQAASSDVSINGHFLKTRACSPLYAVAGQRADNNRKILVCAGDTKSARYVNGATKRALRDHKTYNILGTLHEGTLSVSEVAVQSE